MDLVGREVTLMSVTNRGVIIGDDGDTYTVRLAFKVPDVDLDEIDRYPRADVARSLLREAGTLEGDARAKFADKYQIAGDLPAQGYLLTDHDEEVATFTGEIVGSPRWVPRAGPTTPGLAFYWTVACKLTPAQKAAVDRYCKARNLEVTTARPEASAGAQQGIDYEGESATTATP